MVCVPCILIPVLLYIWHKFFQPWFLRFWNPWEKKDAEGNVIKAGPEFPFQCKGDSCPFPTKKNKALYGGSDEGPTDDSNEAAPTDQVKEAEAKKAN